MFEFVSGHCNETGREHETIDESASVVALRPERTGREPSGAQCPENAVIGTGCQILGKLNPVLLAL